MKKLSYLLIFLIIANFTVKAQSEGDYRSYQTGDWGVNTNWEKYVNGNWVYPAPEAPPTGNLKTTVTILSGHTITATSNIKGSDNAIIKIDTFGILDMKGFYIAKNLPTSPNRFPNLIINGSLFTNSYVSTTNFSIGDNGYFKTAYSTGQEGWYLTTNRPISVSINGTIEYSYNGNQNVAGVTYKNLILSGSGTKKLISNTIVTDSLEVRSGVIFDLNGDTLTIGGNIKNDGTIQDNSSSPGIVIFNGDDQIIGGSGTYIFPKVSLSGTETKKLETDSIRVTGLLTINSGTKLDINGKKLYINGTGLVNNGELNDLSESDLGSVIFDGQDQYIDGSGTFEFPDLTFTGSGNKTLNINEITVSGTLNIDEGTNLNMPYIEYINIYFLGGGLINNGSFTTTDLIAFLIFDGNDQQIISGSGTFSGIFSGFLFGSENASKALLTNTSLIRTSTIYVYSELILGPESKVEVMEFGEVEIDDDAILMLQSSATSTASLILNANISLSGTAIAERYLSGEQWHIISPPLSDQSINEFLKNEDNKISFKDPEYAMTDYLENKADTAGGWNNYYDSSTSGDLESGKGYLLRRDEDGPVKISGYFITGDHSIDISRKIIIVDDSPIDTTNGWNCIGNPFTSSIGIRTSASTSENFLDKNANQLDPSYAALYIFDPEKPKVYQLINNANAGGRYLSQDFLQSGQGFIVRSKAGGGTISFTRAMQSHQPEEKFFKKSGTSSWPYINLNVKTNEKSASTSILFNENMTRGLDVTYDAGLFGGDPALKIYTRLVEDNGVNFALQCLPDFETDEMIVPVGLDLPAGGIITFSAETFNLPAGYKAMLEDKEKGVFADLKPVGSEYVTACAPGTKGNGRFFLHILSYVTDVNDISEDQGINIFSYGKDIYIQSNLHENIIVRIYDISGKLVKTQNLGSEFAGINIIRAEELRSGIYFVKLESKEHLKTGKIYLE